MPAYFSLIQRELKITKFEGRAVGKSQMLSLCDWLLVWMAKPNGSELETRTKLQELHHSCARGAARQPAQGHRTVLIPTSAQCSGCPAEHRHPACVVGVFTTVRVCKQGKVVFLPSAALALHWELQYNCCTDLSELEMTLTHIKQDLSKGIQMSLTHWVKQVLKWCGNLLCGFHPPQCCNFF